jgi:hypothetical protein
MKCRDDAIPKFSALIPYFQKVLEKNTAIYTTATVSVTDLTQELLNKNMNINNSETS